MWFPRDRVHHGQENMAWEQKHEAEKSYFIHAQEAKKEKNEAIKKKTPKSAPSDILPPARLVKVP